MAAATAYLFFTVDGLKTDLHSMRESVLAELAKVRETVGPAENVSLSEIADKEAIYASIKQFLGKGK